MGKKKNPNAQALGSLGGKARAEALSEAALAKIAGKGGKARAAKLSAAERSRIGKLAAATRTQDKGESIMRTRKQNGTIVRIGQRWYVRYWERRNIGGTIERKRVTHLLGDVTTHGKRQPADIEDEAERHMASVNSGAIPAERIVKVGDFVSRVYLPWIEQHKRPSTAKGYRDIWEDHLQARAESLLVEGCPHFPRSGMAKRNRQRWP